MMAVNVEGTRNIISACQRLGVPRLIYTSSASVVFEGRHLYGADERLPYATRPMDFYTDTKASCQSISPTPHPHTPPHHFSPLQLLFG